MLSLHLRFCKIPFEICFKGFLVPDVTCASYAREYTTQKQAIRRPIITQIFVLNQITFLSNYHPGTETGSRNIISGSILN